MRRTALDPIFPPTQHTFLSPHQPITIPYFQTCWNWKLYHSGNHQTLEHIWSLPMRNSSCGWVFDHLGARMVDLLWIVSSTQLCPLKPSSRAFQGSGIQLSGVMHQTLPEQGRYYGILHIEQLKRRPPASGPRFEMQNWERYLFLWDRLRMAVAPPIAHLLLISPSNALPRPFLSHQSLSSTIFRGRVLQRNRNLHIFTDIVRIGGERGVDHKSISTYLKTQIYKIRKF